MAHWRDTMVDRPETDGAVYVTGWRSVDWPFSGPSLRASPQSANALRDISCHQM
jgi:hypothetical protein